MAKILIFWIWIWSLCFKSGTGKNVLHTRNIHCQNKLLPSALERNLSHLQLQSSHSISSRRHRYYCKEMRSVVKKKSGKGDQVMDIIRLQGRWNGFWIDYVSSDLYYGYIPIFSDRIIYRKTFLG